MTILDECKTTNQITYETGLRLADVRAQLIRMHHLGLVCPVAVKAGEDEGEFVDYFHDIYWEATIHMREHSYHAEGCYGCKIRELLLMVDAGLYE